MLFGYEGEPLSPGDLFVDWEVKPPANSLDVFTLLDQDSGKDRDARRMENAIDLRKQVDDDVGSEVCQQEMNAVADDRIHGAAERPDVCLVIELNISGRDV